MFLGGLPWDVNQASLLDVLQKYVIGQNGQVRVEVPGKDAKHPRVANTAKAQERTTPGYLYIIFDQEASVQRMLADCRKETKNGGEHYFYNIFIPTTNFGHAHGGCMATNKRPKYKEVEVITRRTRATCHRATRSTRFPPK